MFAEIPRLVMRHEAIEVACAQVRQVQAPPPHHNDVLGMSAQPYNVSGVLKKQFRLDNLTDTIAH